MLYHDNHDKGREDEESTFLMKAVEPSDRIIASTSSLSELEQIIRELRHENNLLKKTMGMDESKKSTETSFCFNLIDRGAWLFGLLFFQSTSSFILAANQKLIDDHPAIIYFLTMLVGAGGNAGNQVSYSLSYFFLRNMYLFKIIIT